MMDDAVKTVDAVDTQLIRMCVCVFSIDHLSGFQEKHEYLYFPQAP